MIPEWTQPSLSAEEIRRNGGVPPAPEPMLPTDFTIQLYNPDQQVVVRQRPGSLGHAPKWEFALPQQTFRTPSASALDRTQHDPAASENTPKITFKWKKDGKFAKDLTCFLSGKTAEIDGARKKSKEPDITVGIFKGLKEVTLYEPNLQRVEMEDMKGLEIVLLLGAVVIRDVYFGHLRDTFNISTGSRKASNATSPVTGPLLSSPSPPHHLAPGGAPVLPPREPRVPRPTRDRSGRSTPKPRACAAWPGRRSASGSGSTRSKSGRPRRCSRRKNASAAAGTPRSRERRTVCGRSTGTRARRPRRRPCPRVRRPVSIPTTRTTPTTRAYMLLSHSVVRRSTPPWIRPPIRGPGIRLDSRT